MGIDRGVDLEFSCMNEDVRLRFPSKILSQ